MHHEKKAAEAISWPKYTVLPLSPKKQSQTSSRRLACYDATNGLELPTACKNGTSFRKVSPPFFEYFTDPGGSSVNVSNRNDTLRFSRNDSDENKPFCRNPSTIQNCLEGMNFVKPVAGLLLNVSESFSNSPDSDIHEIAEETKTVNEDATGGSIYRRTTRGLVDLIRLHEEEIARASGECVKAMRKVKKFKSKVQTSVEFFNLNPGEKVQDDSCSSDSVSRLGDIDVPYFNVKVDKNESVTIPDQLSAQRFFSTMTNNFCSNSKQRFLSGDKIDKSTSTEPPTNGIRTGGTNRELLCDREEEIRKLIAKNKELIQKLEEQKKVANAYQKLEDRYRKKVYELEKIISNCHCGFLVSNDLLPQKSASKTVPRFV